ncbi:MAG: acetate--CoA ligase family protein, partial [Desulfobacteraceae bacterium]|nr:acetate--CoA ligase family protein [Desulfobacteraceae bacterium]
MIKQKLKESSREIIAKSKALGWVLEPDAKELMKIHGLDIPAFTLTDSFETADKFLNKVGSPVVVKAVSKQILHKTEYQAVVTGVSSSDHLKREMERLQKLEGCENILVEEMIQGIEVIIGAKN